MNVLSRKKYIEIKKNIWRDNLDANKKKLLMAKYREIAKKYAEYLRDTEIIKFQTIIEVENKINKLSYTETRKSISKADKLIIIDYILEELGSNTSLNESESIDSLIKLVNEIKDRIKNE